MMTSQPERSNLRRVVVVGPCASGKSTLVERLMAAGYDAYGCAQEHSEIASLWNHLGPDVVVALAVDLPTIRERRGEEWPETIFQMQIRRLQQATKRADIVINTALTSADETFALTVDMLMRLGVQRDSVQQNAPGDFPSAFEG